MLATIPSILARFLVRPDDGDPDTLQEVGECFGTAIH
jgi:hypothetical protein